VPVAEGAGRLLQQPGDPASGPVPQVAIPAGSRPVRRRGAEVAATVGLEAADPFVKGRASDPLRAGDGGGGLAASEGQQGGDATELGGVAGGAGEAFQRGPFEGS
jgi:hypothetical protein